LEIYEFLYISKDFYIDVIALALYNF